jgi:hypothetical protein
MPDDELVRLRDFFPTTSKMTRWRIENSPGFPRDDGIDINGTTYYPLRVLKAYAKGRRRPAPKNSFNETEIETQ